MKIQTNFFSKNSNMRCTQGIVTNSIRHFRELHRAKQVTKWHMACEQKVN